jgi:hypothetical protein
MGLFPGGLVKPRLIAFALAGVVALFAAQPTRAESFTFSISGAGITASGSLTVTPLGGGIDLITGLNGKQNGQKMTLLGIGGFDLNDNVLYTSSSDELDSLGFSFAAGGHNYKVYFNEFPALLGGSETYYETSVLGALGGKVSFATPEPPVYLLLAVGLLGLLITRRKLLKSNV